MQGKFLAANPFFVVSQLSPVASEFDTPMQLELPRPLHFQNGATLASTLQCYASNQLFKIDLWGVDGKVRPPHPTVHLFDHVTHTILSDSSKSISSISTNVVHQLGLWHPLLPPSKSFWLAPTSIPLSHASPLHYHLRQSHFLTPNFCDWFLKHHAIIDFTAHQLLVPQAPPILLLRNSLLVPHLSQVHVALSPQERLISSHL